MRNYLYLFLFLLLGTGSIAAQEPVTTITFHVGDSLTIGLPYEPGEGYQTMGWSKGDMKIPAFAKGKLQKRIIPAGKDWNSCVEVRKLKDFGQTFTRSP